MIYLIYQIRLPIVIGEPEWCLMTHKIINSHNHNIVYFISTGRPLKCLPIGPKNFQLPQAIGRPLNAHPGFRRNLNVLFSNMCWLFCYCFLIILDTTVHHISNESEDM